MRGKSGTWGREHCSEPGCEALPNPATIRVSAVPTRINRSCSTKRGMTSRKISRLVKIVYRLSSAKENNFFI